MLGTTTEGAADADNLTIADSGDCGITIRTGTTSTGSIYFSDATSGAAEADGFIDYNQSSRYLRFATAQSERMRIDTSGNVKLNGDSPFVYLSDNDNNWIRGKHSGLNQIRFGTNNQERMRIDNSGNMSLGSSTINLTAANRTTLSLNGTNSSLLAFNYSDTISGFFYAEATEFRMDLTERYP